MRAISMKDKSRKRSGSRPAAGGAEAVNSPVSYKKGTGTYWRPFFNGTKGGLGLKVLRKMNVMIGVVAVIGAACHFWGIVDF